MTSDIVVVKCGGNAAVDPAGVCADVADLVQAGRRVVVVHGGSADIERLAGRLGVVSRRLIAPDGVSARYTDDAMLEVVGLALGGVMQPRLVTMLVNAGVSAVGLSGWDGGLLRARRKKAHRSMVGGRLTIIRDDHSGRVDRVDAALLRALLAAGRIPVVSPPALAEDGRPVNVDADRAAAAVAGALDAEALVLLTGAPGVLSDPADEGSVITDYALARTGTPEYVSGGMALKLVAAREALLAGVPRVLIGDGRVGRPVSEALSGKATTVALAPLTSDDSKTKAAAAS